MFSGGEIKAVNSWAMRRVSRQTQQVLPPVSPLRLAESPVVREAD